MTWYNAIVNSTVSTTQYLKDHYSGVIFRVVGQEELDGKIVRTSEFLKDGKIIVHSTVEMPIDLNPPEFIRLMRLRVKPIGDVLKENGYRVDRQITSHDTIFKEYEMKGDVSMKITEIYYDM
jgi:hypothetical protein